MKREKSWRREDGFLLRPGKQEDAEAYYSQNYCPLDGEAARATREFAFAELKLHRLELDVFSFNPRAERCYRKAGFRREGVRRDAVVDSATGAYGDDILMALLEEEWKAVKQNET